MDCLKRERDITHAKWRKNGIHVYPCLKRSSNGLGNLLRKIFGLLLGDAKFLFEC